MSWQDALTALGSLQADVPLAPRTTLGVGGCADWLFRPQSEEGLVEAMRILPQATPIFPMGRGSNVLIADSGIAGMVLDLGDLNRIHVDGVVVQAGAGVRMGKLAQTVAGKGLEGLAFMATVPGDVGGGVAMNAGAFGQQVSDVLESVVLLHRDGSVERMASGALAMTYRYTALPQDALVLSATFALKQGDAAHIKAMMREMRAQRSQTQPLAQPNCGSVFKNPEGDYAARLIESVGLKGKQIGRANISEKHANFIVNQGGASCEDILGLMRLAKSTVKAKTGVDLEPEVRLVGCEL